MPVKYFNNFNCHILNLFNISPRSSKLLLLHFAPKNERTTNNSLLQHRSINYFTIVGANNTLLRCSQSCDGSGFDWRESYNQEICEYFELSTSCNPDFYNGDGSDIDIIPEITEIDSAESYNGYYSSMSYWVSSKLELFGPSFFGMKPDPPLEYWPKDEGTERSASFALEVEQRRTSNVATTITMLGEPSVKLAKMKKQSYYWQMAGDFSYCSVRKVFTVTVFMIRELLSYVISIRESLYCEDLRKVMDQVQMEIGYTFAWLFESIFAKTPTLMVSVMLLLANFTAYSMADTIKITVGVPMITSNLDSYCEEEEECIGEEIMACFEGKQATRLSSHERLNSIDKELSKTSMVSSLTDCVKTNNMLYQMTLGESPRYSLLFLNSALFLNPNPQLHDRVEECFKKAIMMEPCDAELKILYADFLWLVKKDLMSAEENYQEAVEVDPSYYHVFKYATFLLETGNLDICFPTFP